MDESIATLTDEERRVLHPSIAAGKESALKLAHARILLLVTCDNSDAEEVHAVGEVGHIFTRAVILDDVAAARAVEGRAGPEQDEACEGTGIRGSSP